MKIIQKMMAALFCLLMTAGIWAQDAKNQAFWIHEDRVKPSMMAEYEKVSKGFVDACKKHALKDVQWATASMDDGTYLYISPIQNMADLDKNSFAPLREAMGDDEFSKIFQNFDKCYDSHGDYIAILNSELSYMPDGLTTETPGRDYRVWHRLDVTPSNIQNLRGKMKELKTLFANKGSKMHYRIYHTGFGNVGNYYVAVISAKDAQDYDRMSEENDKLLGEEGQKLFQEMFKYVDNYSVKRGGMRPDLAYKGAPSGTKITKN
ncbi:hypothetical protein NE848_14975 [Gramella jeungdoensis]|uniref:Uncharacterized protein n=1 Tax=Gramella jeungdoensis TaxID=708091 RepID=A0ABT0Z4M5_9FLAO|nr:hypothetical protein [Gramella jeungdoensis]MCM8570696.1 hypothetical protein [Gramella jeungdoensis]